MERIVQLSESEYERLEEISSLNDEEIEARAKKLYEDQGVAQLKVNVSINDKYLSQYRIKCNAYGMYVKGEDDGYTLSEEMKKDLEKCAEEIMEKEVKEEYESGVDVLNRANRRNAELDKFQRQMTLIALSGWTAFGALLFFSFLK